MKMRNSVFFCSLLLVITIGVNYAQAETVELVVNGNFGSLSLSPWTQIDPASPQEWGVTSGGNVGAESIHAADYSSFATPWTNGPNPSTTTISQKIDLTPYIGSIQGNTLHISADMIYSSDGIEANVKYYDSADNELSSVFLASKRAYSGGGYNYQLNMDLTIPSGATSIEILFTGHLYDGSYIDAGFDNVSLTAQTVPEPIALSFLIAGFAMIRRYRR